MNTPDSSLLAEVLRHALDGIAIVDGAGGAPRVIYANATLAALLRRADVTASGLNLPALIWPIAEEVVSNIICTLPAIRSRCAWALPL